MGESVEVLQGTLDLLILKTLALGPLHGWGISKRVRDISNDMFRINQGSLYPALYRLEDKGWIDAEWGESADGRRAKVYRLTAKGHKAFAAEKASWRTFASTVELVLSAR
jgi:transcriptional regulator